MISLHIRRMAAQINMETGRSIQEILESIVRAAHSGIVDFAEKHCMLCGSKHIVTTKTQTLDVVIIRQHKCSFCGATFRSEEKTLVPSPEKPIRPIAEPKKKPHIKKRGK